MALVYSIVIPTCNRKELLSLCLDKLAPNIQKVAYDKYEIIVTDDGNIFEDEQFCKKYPHVQFINGPKKGPAANRNNGAKNAKGEWLIFLDDDCIPDTYLLNNYQNAIARRGDIKVFEGRIYVDTPKYSLGITTPVNLTGGYLWACNFLISRELFFQLGGFDEQFPYPAMEDVDLKLRIDQFGEEIVFVDDAAVCHPWRKKGGWKKVMQHNDSTFIYLKKHPYEKARINTLYYLKFNARIFLYETLPGIVKYKGKGCGLELVHHAGSLLMAFKLLLKKSHKN